MQCVCDKKGDPLCGYCADDLFCPQCGEPIFELISENEPPRNGNGHDRRELWTYAQIPTDDPVPGSRHECRFSFGFWTRNLTRERTRRSLRLEREALRFRNAAPVLQGAGGGS